MTGTSRAEKVDFNIEAAHIYTSHEFGPEHIKSVKILRRLVSHFPKGTTFSAGVMVDDFLENKPIDGRDDLDVKRFLGRIQKGWKWVDWVAYESQMKEFADDLISLIPAKYLIREKTRKGRGEMITFQKGSYRFGLIQAIGEPSCVLLVAVWYLMRLGYFPLPAGLELVSEKPFVGKQLITILPKQYQPAEENVMELLKATKYGNAVKQMEYKFF